jgi:hypothetical protein
MNSKQFTITKRIAKHDDQAIIVIPRIIEENLRPGTIVQVTLEVIKQNSLTQNTEL